MGRIHSKRGRYRRLRMTFAAIAGLGVPGLVQASQYNFTGPSAGNWNVASSWTLVGGSTHQIPINGDDAFLGVSGTTAVSSYYTQTYTGAGLNSLNIDSANGSNPFTFYQVTAGYAMVAGTENVGITGSNAIYNESIGSNTATTLNLGTQSTGAGTYLLSASGTLSTTEEAIGAGGTGNFIQNGGTNTITAPVSGETTTAGNLYIGASGSSTGSTYTLNGGNLNLSNSAFLFDGGGSPYVSTNAPKGVLIQTAGVINLSGYGAMWVGASSASSGSRYDLSASGQLTGGQGIEVGQNCTAAVDQSGGSINTEDIVLGSYGTGIYNLSSGSATLSYEIIGQLGNGIVQQSGGVQTVTGGGGLGLNIGFISGLGIFNLSAGTVNSLGITQIGGGNSYNPGNGTGLLNIWGTGNMNLGGGGLVVSTTGPGAVNQSGGTVSTSSLQIATANYSGSYLFSAGSALTVLGSETIGVASAGTFTQTGGTHIVGSELILSSASGVTSSLNLSGGVLSVGDSVTVGSAGTGSITQNGGIFNVSNTLYISNLAGSVGSFALQSGVLSAGSVYVGYSGTGSFLQTGGSLNVSNGLFVGSITPATYTLNGGALNLPANPTAGLQGNIFYQSAFYQSGGSVSGTLNNSGNYYFTGGTFPGMFANGESGYASFSSGVSFGAGFSNLGTVVIQSTVSLGTAAGQTLLNQGQINAYSAQLNSAGPIVNDGSIYITGLLGGTGGMTNNALITQGSGFLSIAFTNAAPLVNNGTIDLAANLTTSISGTLNNAGTFATNGAFVTGSGLLANLIGGTINGPGMIATSFSNAGIVVPGTGTLNIASSWNNSGAVELTAVTSTITGGAINNLGTIQGFGYVGSNVNNSRGTVNALGGTLVIGGTLTNPASGTITASSGNEVLVNSGLVTNAGLISLTGGTYDNGGYNLSNTGQITGYGTLRTGGLVNSGIFTLSGTGTNGTTTVNGNVTNNTAINIRYQLAIFTGNIVNLGTITTFGTTVTFSGTFIRATTMSRIPAPISFRTA